LIAAADVMMTVVVMRALRGLDLLLQRPQRLLRLPDVAGLQCIADLADGLGKRPAALIDLRERRIGALRGAQVAGLQRADQLPEGLADLVLIIRWRNKRR